MEKKNSPTRACFDLSFKLEVFSAILQASQFLLSPNSSVSFDAACTVGRKSLKLAQNPYLCLKSYLKSCLICVRND